MFRIKICGLTRPEDVRAAVEAGANAIGLNFYLKSSRYVSVEQANELARECPQGVSRVGVFVNAKAEEIRRIVEAVSLDVVQLHGDEPVEIMSGLRGLKVIRAIRPQVGEWSKWETQLAAFQVVGPLAGVLVDAPSTTEFGGTGQKADWEAVVANRHLWQGLPLILAGGLKPGNVAAAIRAVRPDAVDTASGVESSPGIKDAVLVREFVSQARMAFRE